MAVPSTALAAGKPKPPPTTAPTGIGGTVYSAADGTGIAGATVTAYQYNKSRGWQSKGTTTTASGGSFTMLLSAGTYCVGFSAANFKAEYFDDAASLTDASSIAVTSGRLTPCSAQLTSPFIEGGTRVEQAGLDAFVSWTLGAGPYEVWRSATPSAPTSWERVASTVLSYLTDPAPFRTAFRYKVRDVGANQWTAASVSISLVAGTGTSGDPYLVRSLNDLDNVRKDLSADYRQIAHINATTTATWNGGAGWMSIGSSNGTAAPFQGSYDGGRFNIVGLTAYRPSQTQVGLFGAARGARLSGIVLLTPSIFGSNWVGGILASSAYETTMTTISDCTVNGWIRGSSHVGGIVGGGQRLDVSDCVADGTVAADSSLCGGAFGYLDYSSVRTVTSAAAVNGAGATGGLVGESWSTSFDRCVATGDVSGGLGTYTGGFAGDLFYHGTVRDSYATGNVFGGRAVGGFVGRIVDYGTKIERCYSAGSVGGLSMVGGFVGELAIGAEIDDSYYLASAYATSSAGQPKTVAELQNPATFYGWDLVNIWNPPVPGISYPTLRPDAPY